MLKCPKCGIIDTIVVDSRDYGEYIRRRRKCRKCGHRQTTFERVEAKAQRHIGSNEGSVPQKQENISPEQIERYRAAFKCLELAKAELPDSNLVSIACEYGAGINLTREECENLLNMKVRDVINLEI